MTSISKILKTLLILDILILVITSIAYSEAVIYTMQVGFISASLIMFGSMISYKKMIDTRVEHNIVTIDDSKDVIDELEDPYDLYSEDEIKSDEEADLVETVKEERQRLKQDRRSLQEILKDSKGALSVYRLLAYVSLILGFLYLNRHGLLHIPSYILSLGIVPIVIVVILLKEKEEDKNLNQTN